MVDRHRSAVHRPRRGAKAIGRLGRIGLVGVLIVSLQALFVTDGIARGGDTRPTIKIGTYAPLSDNDSGVTYPQIPAAVEAAVRAINRDGGFNGARADVVVCDTKENPNGAADCGRAFVDEGVVAVVGGFTLQGRALIPILADAGIPNIGMVANNAEDSVSPISFPLDGSLLAFPAQALQLGDTRDKQLYVARADIADAAVVPRFIEAAAATSDVSVVGVGSAPLGTPDLVPYASAAQSSGATAVSLIFPNTDAVKFILAADQIGYTPRFTYTEGGLTPDDLEQVGDLVDGMLTPGAFPPVSAAKQFPELVRYKREMRAQLKTGDDGAARKYYGSSTIRPWLAVQALKAIIDASPGEQPTSVSVLDGLNSATDVDLGLIPPWTPSSSPISIFPRISNPYMYEMRIEDGKYVLGDREPVNLAEEVDFAAALRG
jgi:ABC-type branched-subunit amino acid transport system substrate-binding protein